MDHPASPESIHSSPKEKGSLDYFRAILMSQPSSPSFNYSSPGRVLTPSSPQKPNLEDAPEQPVKHRTSSGGVAVPRTPIRRVHSITPLYAEPEVEEEPEKSTPPVAPVEPARRPHPPAPLVITSTKKPSPPGGFPGSRDLPFKEDPTSPSSFKIHTPTFKLANSYKPTLSLAQNSSSGIVRISTPVIAKPVVLPPARNETHSNPTDPGSAAPFFSTHYDEIVPESQEDPATSSSSAAIGSSKALHQIQQPPKTKKRKRSSSKKKMGDEISPKNAPKSKFRAIPLYDSHTEVDNSIDQTTVQFAPVNYDEDHPNFSFPPHREHLSQRPASPPSAEEPLSEIPPTPEEHNGDDQGANKNTDSEPFGEAEDADADAIVASPVASPRRHAARPASGAAANAAGSGGSVVEVVDLDFADIENDDEEDSMDVEKPASLAWDQLLPSAMVLAPATASPTSPIKNKFSHLNNNNNNNQTMVQPASGDAGRAEDVDSSIDEQGSRPNNNTTIDFVDKSMEDQFDDVEADILSGADDEELLARAHNAARAAQMIRIRSVGGADEDSESIVEPTIESSAFAIPPADDAAFGDRLVLVNPNVPTSPVEPPTAPTTSSITAIDKKSLSVKLQSKFDVKDKNTQYRDVFAPGTKLFSSLVGAGSASTTIGSASASFLVKKAHDLAKSLFFFGKKSLDSFLSNEFDVTSIGVSFSESASTLIAHVLQVECDRFLPGLWTLKCRLLFPNAPSGHPTSVFSKVLLRAGWNDSSMTDQRLTAPVAGSLLALMASSHMLLEHRPLPLLLCAVWYPITLDLGFDPAADLPVFIEQFEQFKASGTPSEASEANQSARLASSSLSSSFPGSRVASVRGKLLKIIPPASITALSDSEGSPKKRPSDLSLLDVSALVHDAAESAGSPGKRRKISEFAAAYHFDTESQNVMNEDLTLGGLASMPASAPSQVTCASDILSRLFRERLNISSSISSQTEMQSHTLILQLEDGSIVAVAIASRFIPAEFRPNIGSLITLFELKMIGHYYEKYGSPSSPMATKIEEILASDPSILPVPVWNMINDDSQMGMPKFLNNSESQTDAVAEPAALVEKPPTPPPVEQVVVTPKFHRWCYLSLEYLPTSTINLEETAVPATEPPVAFSRLHDILEEKTQHPRVVSFVCRVVAGPQLVSIGITPARPSWAVFCWDDSLAHLSGRVMTLIIDQSMVKNIHTSDILLVKNALAVTQGGRHVELPPNATVGKIMQPRLGAVNFSSVLDATLSQLEPSQTATQLTQSSQSTRRRRTKKTAATAEIPLIDFTNETPIDLLSSGDALSRTDIIPSRLYRMDLVDCTKPLYFQWCLDNGDVVTSRSLEMSHASIASYGGSLGHPQDLQPGDILFLKGTEMRGSERQVSSIKVCQSCGSKLVETPRLLVFSPQERREQQHFFCSTCVSRKYQQDDQVIDLDVVTVKDYFGRGVDLRLLAAPHGKSARTASSKKSHQQQWTFPAGFKALLLHLDPADSGCDVLCLSDKLFL